MIDVKKLAEQAGIDVSMSDVSGPLVYEAEPKHLEAFAALVLEEAAKACDVQNGMQGIVWVQAVEACADTIRAMKPGKPS